MAGLMFCFGLTYDLAMCSHYQGIKERERYVREFGVPPPDDIGKYDVWPGYAASFIRRHPHADVGDEAVPEREALSGVFGLIPHWSADTKITRFTYNARSETAASKPSFRDAWQKARHCIIPADAIYEPDWRSRKPIATRIARTDGQPMGIAGLWSSWKSPQGKELHSYSMLTINATEHALMRDFHKPTDEKRMVVILPESRYAGWLLAEAGDSEAFMRQFPAEQLAVSKPESSVSLF